MNVALAQINPKVGDIEPNAERIARFTARAREAGADLVVFPELALVGYPPRDLLHQEGFIEAAAAAATRLGQGIPGGITAVFGVPLPVDAATGRPHGISNSLVAYRDGKLVASYDKRLLPTYDVFDEDRYFVPGATAAVIDVPSAGGAFPVGLSICEDLWRAEDVGSGLTHRYHNLPDPVAELMAARTPDGRARPPRLIVNPSASPFVLGKGQRHREILRRHAQKHGVYVAAVNQAGGNDELIFDGHAAVMSPDGRLIAAGPGFEEALTICSIGGTNETVSDPLDVAAPEELLFHALRIGVRDYLHKIGFRSSVLGLSGGIDSAVVCVLAAAALGPQNVLGISLPSRYSSEGSLTDAEALARRVGVQYQAVPIETGFQTLLGAVAPVFGDRPADLAEENLQSRIRGTLLMAVSNKLGHLLLTTGNKSESAVGYCTLYGDMNGGLAVLSDVTKEYVYRLARWMNANWKHLGIAGLAGPPIPDESITKPPSAELRPDQTDQDSLPPYPVLDEIIDRYVERRQSASRIITETGFDAAVVRRMLRLIDMSEFKRKQAATGLKVTGLAFGSGRRMPIVQGWKSP